MLNISNWPSQFRYFVVVFILVLNFGYFSGLNLLELRTSLTPKGVNEQVLGNEDEVGAREFKFKMSEAQLSGLIHTHVIALAPIFLILGLLFSVTNWPNWLKRFCTFELMLSLVFTFGGLKLLWLGNAWALYVIILSGGLMHLGFVIISLGTTVQLLKPSFRSRD